MLALELCEREFEKFRKIPLNLNLVNIGIHFNLFLSFPQNFCSTIIIKHSRATFVAVKCLILVLKQKFHEIHHISYRKKIFTEIESTSPYKVVLFQDSANIN